MTTPYITQLNPGDGQTLLVKSDGTVWTWGDNVGGQLGTGMRAQPRLLFSTNGIDAVPKYAFSSVPTQVDLPPIQQVAGGGEYSIALSASGTAIYSWGANTQDELGLGRQGNSVVYKTTPVEVDLSLPTGVTVVSIAGGLYAAYALLSNGQVMAWGSNDSGQTGQSGRTLTSTPQIVPGLSNVTAISAGDGDAMALEANGTVWAWGDNTYGELGPQGPTTGTLSTSTPVEVTGLPPISMITSGGNDNVAVDAGGNVYTWGRNRFGELGQGTIDPKDGPHPTPTLVSGLTNIVSIDGDGPSTLAADSFGNVYAFGDNTYGEIGNGTETNTGTPTLVLTIPTSPDSAGPSVQVAAGHYFSYAFNAVTGETYAWGQNSFGQLGITRNENPNPTPINVTSDILSGTNPMVAERTMAFLRSVGIGSALLASSGETDTGNDTMGALGTPLTKADLHSLISDLLPIARNTTGYSLDEGPGTAGLGAHHVLAMLRQVSASIPPQHNQSNEAYGPFGQ